MTSVYGYLANSRFTPNCRFKKVIRSQSQRYESLGEFFESLYMDSAFILPLLMAVITDEM